MMIKETYSFKNINRTNFFSIVTTIQRINTTQKLGNQNQSLQAKGDSLKKLYLINSYLSYQLSFLLVCDDGCTSSEGLFETVSRRDLRYCLQLQICNIYSIYPLQSEYSPRSVFYQRNTRYITKIAHVLVIDKVKEKEHRFSKGNE